jgi:hypothetical protein
MMRLLSMCVFLVLLTACSDNSRRMWSQALLQSADNIGRSRICTTTMYGGKHGRYTASSFCY